ncbi:MAG: thioesterase [Candidatus Sumerlaeia bacterium]
MRIFESDAGERLTVPALCNYFQEAASCHAFELGLDVQRLIADHRITWVLSRFHMQVYRRPAWRERVCVETWPSDYSRLLARREFRLLNDRGDLLAAATSSWVLIDLERRRPIRLPRYVIEKLPPPAERAMEEPTGSVPGAKTGGAGRREFSVRFSDLDINRHVNHVAYISWAVETTPVELQRQGELRELSAEFLDEAHLGESVISLADRAADAPTPTFYHSLRRQGGDGGRDLARLRTIWRLPK